MKKAISELQVGDKVIVSNMLGEHLFQVEKVTRTQIVVNRNHYRKFDGIMVGDDLCVNRIKVADEDMINTLMLRHRRQEYIQTIRYFDLNNLLTEDLERMAEIIQRYK